MEIQDIKSRLKITEVANHLGIKIGKNSKAHCPFHPDKTPSLQFSDKKGIATCFSSNCNLGTVDIIGLTERKLNISTHEAIKYLSELAGERKYSTNQQNPIVNMNTQDYQKAFEQMQSSFLSSSTARKYAESRNLDWKKLQIGYNPFKQSKFNYLRGCITFGLKDKEGKTVSMYGRSVKGNGDNVHYYTANRQGLYPGYPEPTTKKLILTESIIDTATLLQCTDALQCVSKDTAILALYGTNGLTTEHINAIQQSEQLQEIILFLDGDDSGRAATEKHGQYLQQLLPHVKLSKVETPENEDINSLSLGHTTEIFIELIQNRIPFSFSEEPSSENIPDEKEKEPSVKTQGLASPEGLASPQGNRTDKAPPCLNTSNHSEAKKLHVASPYKITYPTQNAIYHVKGGLPKALDTLRVTLEIEHPSTGKKSRTKPDLYEDKQVEKVSREAGEKLNIRADLLETDLNLLTDLLDEHREKQIQENNPEEITRKIIIPMEEQKQCITFMSKPRLIQRFNKLIEKSGIMGEEKNRIFLFGIAASYKMPETLHALVQGSSGSGKTYLVKLIIDLMPEEDVIRLTRVTENSFYNYGEYELQHKLICIEDVDGLKEEAEYAFRELQSNGELISSTSVKNEGSGDIRAKRHKVKGPIGSIATTTHGEIYEDNMSRIFLLAVDESKAQTNKIIEYLNQKSSGMIDKAEVMETRRFIQNCIRLLKPYEVVNPYADKILLPPEAHKIRRLTELFHAFVNQVTLINQYQRKKDTKGRLITEKEDVQTAIDIMFDSIVLKVDELDGSLRQFYENLKEYVQKQGEEYQNYQFTQREIRMELNISKTACQNNINRLLEYEYITKTITSQRNTFHYKIAYWDSLEALRKRIQNYLNQQLEKL